MVKAMAREQRQGRVLGAPAELRKRFADFLTGEGYQLSDGAQPEDVPAGELVVVVLDDANSDRGLVDLQLMMDQSEGSVVAVVPAAASPELWKQALQIAPMTVAAEAGVAELRARLSSAEDARRKTDLAQSRTRDLGLMRRSIEEVALIDMQTGLYNRRFLVTRLREALAAAQRYARPLSLCVIALEGMDALVEEVGEDEFFATIEELVDRLTTSLRSADVTAWLGDGCIALLLPETPTEGANRVMDRVIELAEELSDERNLSLQVQCGVAAAEEAKGDPEALISLASSRAAK